MAVRRKVVMAALVAALLGGGVTTAPPASAEVTYSPPYWQLLERYGSVEATGAPIPGVYGSSPECLLLQQQGEPVACGDMIVILLPDATFSTAGWIEDPAAPDGWRVPSDSECMEIDWGTVDDPDRWAFACGYW